MRFERDGMATPRGGDQFLARLARILLRLPRTYRIFLKKTFHKQTLLFYYRRFYVIFMITSKMIGFVLSEDSCFQKTLVAIKQ